MQLWKKDGMFSVRRKIQHIAYSSMYKSLKKVSLATSSSFSYHVQLKSTNYTWLYLFLFRSRYLVKYMKRGVSFVIWCSGFILAGLSIMSIILRIHGYTEPYSIYTEKSFPGSCNACVCSGCCVQLRFLGAAYFSRSSS